MEDQEITYQVRFDANDMHFRAAVENVNEETRTFDVVFATETPVPKMDWNRYVIVDEILEISEAAIDSSRIAGPSGVPFLDNHNQWTGSRGVYGIAEGLKISGKKAISTIRMSDRPNDPVLDGMWHDIKTGILRTVSVGYRVSEYEKTLAKEGSGKRDIFKAKRWTPMEISAANVPADHNAIKRTEGKENNPTLPENLVEIRAIEVGAPTPKVKTEISQNRNMEKTPEQIALEKRNAELEEQTRKATEELAKIQRENQIRTIVTEANVIATRSGMEPVTPEQTAEYLKGSQSPDQVRAAINANWASADPNKGASGGAKAGADREQFQERAELAMMVRVGAIERDEITPQIQEQTREFMGMTDMRFFEEFARRSGYQGHDAQKIFNVAMQKPGHVEVRSGGSMTTGDLPSLLENVLNKRLIKQLTLRQPTWSQWADTDSTFVDFKPKSMVSLGDMPPLVTMGELDDYTYGATKDGKETMRVGRFGRAIMFSFEMVVNNELGGILSRTPRGFAQRISQKRNETVYGALLANGVMADGNALFSSAHGNICTAAALNAANFQIAKRKMRNQKSLGTPTEAGQFLNLTPKSLIVGPSLEVTADVLMNAQFTPNTLSEVNTARGQAMVIVDPLIVDDSWYLVGDYMDCDHVIMGFMQGWDLGIRMERSWKNDAYDFHVSEIHGVGVADYRNLVYTPSL